VCNTVTGVAQSSHHSSEWVEKLPGSIEHCLLASSAALRSLGTGRSRDVAQTLRNEERLKPDTQMNVKFGSSDDRYHKRNIYTSEGGWDSQHCCGLS